MFTLSISVLVLAAIIFAFSRLNNRNKSGSWLQFYTRGKDAGFSFKEIELLGRLAVRCSLEDPCSLYWSQNQLDICIRSLVRSIKTSGGEEDQSTHDFLSKVYDYRKKIEMEKPRIKNGIASSRQISEGQPLRVLVAGTGVFRSQVVSVTKSYLTITRPVNSKITNMSWTNAKIAVYFWRNEDAGYVFDTKVEDEVFSKGLSSLKITHSDSMFRTQKRKSVRLKMHKAAFLYLLNEGDDAEKLENVPGVKCFLEDLSDTGCGISIGGKAGKGIRVKVQFVLGNSALCMSGTVRSVDFSEEKNRSLLHVEADKLPIERRNRILGEVFGMLPDEGIDMDDDDELPARILDGEAGGTNQENQEANQEKIQAAADE